MLLVNNGARGKSGGRFQKPVQGLSGATAKAAEKFDGGQEGEAGQAEEHWQHKGDCKSPE